MGWKLKALAGMIGIVLVGTAAWPLSLVCFLYLAEPLWRRSGKGPGGKRGGRTPSVRSALVVTSLFLSAAAFASGGTLSPFVFLGAALASLAWPLVSETLPFSRASPVNGSVLVRSKYLPFAWSALAELKPGPDEFARAASAFSGKLLVFTDSGKVYSFASCLAASRDEAEAKVLGAFREAAPAARAGAFLLPLDSVQAREVLSRRLTRKKFPAEKLAVSATMAGGALFLECAGGYVLKASVLDQSPSPSPRLPPKPWKVANPPLSWEVFESIGKGTRWPQPDHISNLLDSMVATRGVPLAERLKGFQTEGDLVKIQSLSGDEVRASRTQLRALVSIYS